MDGQAYQQQLNRQEILEECLLKAKQGTAKESDWEIIYWECGLPAPVKSGVKKEKENGIYCN
jgi:hypothetical protein